MKIYFAYRSGYQPNNRFIKTFEADSVLDWFIQNWESLSTDAVDNFLGIHVYGFPCSDYQTEQPVKAPKSLKDLKSKISNFIYSNEIRVTENCVQVLTDDDEIELAWYVFDEHYAQANQEKLSIWLYPVLPSDAHTQPSEESLKGTRFSPKGTEEQGNVYYFSTTIYDSESLGDLDGAYKITRLSLPNLLTHFRNSAPMSAPEDASVMYGEEVTFMQQLSKLYPNFTTTQLFAELLKYPFATVFEFLNGIVIPNLTLSDLQKISPSLQQQTTSTLSNAIVHEHCIELSTNYLNEFYNYTILFDDYWLNQHPVLGKSIAHFFKTWKI